MTLLYEELFRARQAELLRDARAHRLARRAHDRFPRRHRR
jgi:hypothetical protein